MLILEKNNSTKQIKKQLFLGKMLTTYMTGKKGDKVYDRFEINKLATTYYSDLYNTEVLKTDEP